MAGKITVVSCGPGELRGTPLGLSLRELGLDHIDIIFHSNNNESIASCYNSIRLNEFDDDDVFVFVHDDVCINCGDFENRIRSYIKRFDVVGVAGISQVKIQEPVLWHLMSPDPSAKMLHGCVAHPITNKGAVDKYYYTSFGPMPWQVILADGVLLATTVKVLKQVQFDESNPARYHFYDLSFTLDCCIKKISVGVGDIPIIHMSHGLSERQNEWEDGQKWFMEKYSHLVGKTITV